MKSLFFAILAAGIIAGCSGTDSGEGIIERYAARLKDPRVYVCNHTKGTICMDGCLTEKDWQEARWSEDFVDISTDKVPAKNTRVKMLWDGNYVYIGAKIEEDKIVANLKQRDTIIWKENAQSAIHPGASNAVPPSQSANFVAPETMIPVAAATSASPMRNVAMVSNFP